MDKIRSAPAGFSKETWAQFAEDGILVVKKGMDKNQVELLSSLIESYSISLDLAHGGQKNNIVELHPLFQELINLDSHIGFVYDVYGESLKLLQSQFFIRPPKQAIRNDWHYDGPRVVPFEAFGTKVPMRIKIGYWLTDLPKTKMGNLLFIRGSHKSPYLDQYKTHDKNPNEEALLVEKGDMILMAAGLWHRVDENQSKSVRKNIFLEYGPSWISSSDRFHGRLDLLDNLTREQRIVMRDYSHPNFNIKPPAEDVPLFKLRNKEKDIDSKNYRKHVPIHLRKRSTWLERNQLI